MNAARVRIGRVRLKAGGAALRVLERPPEGRILGALRDFVGRVAGYDEAPTAYAAIAFWSGGDEPWRPPYVCGFETIEPTLPMPLLGEVAAAQLRLEPSAGIVEARVMRNMGYVPADDPDDAA